MHAQVQMCVPKLSQISSTPAYAPLVSLVSCQAHAYRQRLTEPRRLRLLKLRVIQLNAHPHVHHS